MTQSGLRNMRIIYGICAICAILSIVAIILGFLAINQLPYNQTPISNGLNNILNIYRSSDIPMNTCGMMFSADKTKCLLFLDNLYVFDLVSQKVLWKALQDSISLYSFLTLSIYGVLSDTNFKFEYR